MACSNCVGSDCNICLLKRSLKTAAVFVIVSSPQARAVTGDNIMVRTAVFLAIIFLLMKMSQRRSSYYRANPLDMSRSGAYYQTSQAPISAQADF